MDKTATQRQQRYREQIAKGEKKRLQVVLDREEADKLDNICAAENLTKTQFIKRVINQYIHT
ncbi:ribbon-helix-helix protein, CopG family [Arenicella xantha]|uniref:Ribbon-helix-helix CopG family protein n=1 Tax=Arenicella xantha TaxID=644221 RepID=A0A395JLM0_9GAMM|nr:ribbon-helix-helix protein, CopG family [Arenicella xantha]RBP51696.1 ribbon-helix-helix CopG family protein [Arenicella xantha]